MRFLEVLNSNPFGMAIMTSIVKLGLGPCRIEQIHRSALLGDCLGLGGFNKPHLEHCTVAVPNTY